MSAVCVQKRQSWKDRSLSLHRDEERLDLSGGVAYPSAEKQTIASTKARSVAIKFVAVLLAISLLLVAAIETQLKQPVAKTLERVGRSMTLEGQLTAKWFSANPAINNQRQQSYSKRAPASHRGSRRFTGRATDFFSKIKNMPTHLFLG